MEGSLAEKMKHVLKDRERPLGSHLCNGMVTVQAVRCDLHVWRFQLFCVMLSFHSVCDVIGLYRVRLFLS